MSHLVHRLARLGQEDLFVQPIGATTPKGTIVKHTQLTFDDEKKHRSNSTGTHTNKHFNLTVFTKQQSEDKLPKRLMRSFDFDDEDSEVYDILSNIKEKVDKDEDTDYQRCKNPPLSFKTFNF
ncbi:hypothetical protein EIN_380190 [Entamoeba invadens IP1]|uniref:Uncharacterized protein n=1 Tax=Entamoeba invadens IP1 TaxID=370355 RepID=A0A0A1UAM8_ENTIV|nr:hypothetical protein EIN_380190 [Entamoeba invadens IP1]ELP92112.1 hypothetical protein EIN_380190 [Entamoeba invadens IP1]|eukprot:XP_004258883.1 hypothetical protein EIN_380190 [Entamoeba invadens IP1]